MEAIDFPNRIERRYAELRAEGGRRLSGVVVRYGEVSTGLPWRETFMRGAFGDVAGLDVRLNVQHQRDRLLARTGGGGLELTDGPDALRMAADLPETREADDALVLVRRGVLRGLSVEFSARQERQDAGVRVISRASLPGLAVVDSGAYSGSIVAARAEVRQDGEGLTGVFDYNVDRVISDRSDMSDVEERRAPRDRRKVRVVPGAFRFAIESPDREIVVTLGRSYDRPLASKLASAAKTTFSATRPVRAANLVLQDGPDSLRFTIDRLPDTQYVADFRAAVDARAALYGVEAIYQVPPPDVVPDAVAFVPEAAEDGGAIIEVVREAVLTSLAIVSRAPRGNPGAVALRRRRWW